MFAYVVLAASIAVGQASTPPTAVAPFDADRARQHQTDWAAHGNTPVKITNSIGLELVLVPPGEFQMGTTTAEKDSIEDLLSQYQGASTDWLSKEHPPHRVRITKPFYCGTHEVTQDQYQKVVGSNVSEFAKESTSGTAALYADISNMDTSRFPVENVSWDDAVEFCRRLGSLPEERRAGRVYRLPTEAEWEYACRAGTTTPFHFGRALNGRQANCNGNTPFGTPAKGPNVGRPTAVGSYERNAFGLDDMHGNVAEWCQDGFGSYDSDASVLDDPPGPPTGSRRVARGGFWLAPAWGCRSAHRGGSGPTGRAANLGFRVVMECRKPLQ